jgi:wyosine [tRNA(Phe)-imidazoG37] synthetase (radical SAM superfamily)
MSTPTLGVYRNQPREFLDNRFVYAVISSRARGLSIGVNVNPNQACNYNCPFCEVVRTPEKAELKLDLKVLTRELIHVVALAQCGRLCDLKPFTSVPPELMGLKEVALSGDGEPSLVSNFDEVVKEVVVIRRLLSHFKLVVITNGAGLHRPTVQRGIDRLDPEDEIWIKLDAGTEAYMQRVNGPEASMETTLRGILSVAQRRPVIIQSLFCTINDEDPSEEEISAYIQRLADLQAQGAQISLVQIYSASRPPAQPGCKHLPLAQLSHIARRVRTETGLDTEVF